MKTRRIAVLAVLTATAMILSFVESQIPPFTAIPGIKVGLANVAVVFALYALDTRAAALVSAVRVLLLALLFGHPVSLLFSLLGATLSLLSMVGLRRWGRLSAVGVSVAGGIAHNVGQTLAAVLLLGTGVLYYLPVLVVTGTVAGVVVGLAGALLCRRLSSLVDPRSAPKNDNKK